MAPRPFWKGYLKLTLVTCPVAMMPAISEEEKVRFRTMNRATGNPVTSRYVDSETGQVVDDDDQARGYEHAEGKYVILEEEDIDAVALESTRTIDIDLFVKAGSISPLFLDRAHFLIPDDEVGEEAFSVIRDAMDKTGMVGIARLVLYRRERAVMIEPRGRGMVVWTLRYGDEVRQPEEYFKDLPSERSSKQARAGLQRGLAREKRGFDPEAMTDPVDERLKELIAEHRKARGKPARKKAAKAEKRDATRDNVVDIMDALRQSLNREKGRKQR